MPDKENQDEKRQAQQHNAIFWHITHSVTAESHSNETR